VTRRTHAGGLAGCLLLLPGVAAAAGGEGGPHDLAWRLLNVALLMGVLYVFARKPIQEFFRDRREEIQRQLEEAARLRTDAEQRYARWQRQLQDLDTELAGIRATARERAEQERARILEDARAAAERIRSDARAAVDQELRRARARLREETSDLSIQLAGELLRRELGERDRERLIDDFVAGVERGGPGA
jgi:F-type H+-transporting ATPase subunit b